MFGSRQSLLMLVAAFTLMLALSCPTDAQVETFSTGMLTPEDISLAPDSFGSFGGQYFVGDFGRLSSDPATQKIWAVPHNGGAPSLFATGPGVLIGGLFLPNAGWGPLSGNYLTTGRDQKFAGPNPPYVHGQIFTYGANGIAQPFFSDDGGSLSAPRIAPAGFGAYGGDLIVADAFNGALGPGRIYAFDPNGNRTVITSSAPVHPFGLAFAPAGFGALSGQLFVSDVGNGHIDLMAPDGTFSPFANIALTPGHAGLRQMEFSPAGFIPGYGPLLFVSESGTDGGGGVLGDVLALDSSGTIVASLRTDLGLSKFNPRGLYFVNDTQMLISDSSDPILLVHSNAFQVVPESGSLALLSCGLLVPGAAFLYRRRKTSR